MIMLIKYNQFEVCLNLNTEKFSEHVVISTCAKVELFQIIQACTYIMKFEAEKPINPIQDGGGKKMLLTLSDF